nr:MAG TPA: DNA methyltransferase [Caudoviricetes sp.]
MEEIKCKQVGQITAQGYTEMTGRVYGQEGISPTINTCCGGHHEPKILEEPIAYDEQNGYLRKDGIVGTITTDGSSPKHNNRIVEPTERFFKQALDTAESNECEVGDTIDAFNERINKSGISPTVTTRPEGFKTAILPIDQQYRVRKLTERECFKLMGVKQEDFEKIRKNQSKSSCYHLAGDSICCSVLMAIFGQMFDINWKEKINETVEEIIKEVEK